MRVSLAPVFLALTFLFSNPNQAQVPCPAAAPFYNESNIERALAEFRTCRQQYWAKGDYANFFESYWMVLDCISKRQETRTLLEELSQLRDLEEYVPDSLKAANAHVIKQFDYLLNRMTGDLGAAADIQVALLDSLGRLPGPADQGRIGRIFKSLMYLSEVYLDQGRYRQALYNANMAVDTGRLIYEYASTDGFILTPHYILVRTYMLTGDYRGALNELNRILSVIPDIQERQGERRIRTYIDLARLQSRVGAQDSAQYYLSLLKSENPTAQFGIAIGQLQAEIYIAEGSDDKALEMYSSMIDSLVSNGDYNSDVLAELYTDLGDLYLSTFNAPREAADNYHAAIYALSSEPFNEDITANPAWFSLYDRATLISAFEGKSAALDMLDHIDPSTDTYRNAAWRTIGLGLDFVQRMRAGFQTAEDRAKLIEDSYMLFHTAIEHCLKMNHTHGQRTWIDTAFVLMESSKALNLLDDLTHKEARELSGVPDSLIELELAIKADINQLKNRERTLRRTPEINEDEIRRNFLALTRAEASLDSLILRVENDFPGYTDTRRNMASITLDDARNTLKHNETVLEYFSAPGRLPPFLLHFDKKNKGLIKCEMNDDVKSAISTVSLGFKEVLEDNPTTVDNNALIESLGKLYKWLVAPAGDLTENIIIVPDGVVNGLPFAAFISSPSEQSYDLREQAYLVKENTTLYNYSSTLFNRLRREAEGRSQDSYAFSPTIDTSTGFLPLPHGDTEAKQVAERLGAQVLSGKSCTASKVKSILARQGQFGIIHFATHGFANLEHGADSYLQFSGTSDSSQLFAYDLYGLNFDADLVYLSACQTASGSRQAGEGVVSLARAFFGSGAHNLVTTVNNVGDEQAREITDLFYEQLLTGQRVDESLAEAQRAYIVSLSNEERYLAHPAYWSGFVAYGDTLAIYDQHVMWWLWIVLFLTSVVILAYFLTKKRLRR